MCFCWLDFQALDTIKKSGSSFSKDEVKRLEKEVSSESFSFSLSVYMDFE